MPRIRGRQIAEGGKRVLLGRRNKGGDNCCMALLPPTRDWPGRRTEVAPIDPKDYLMRPACPRAAEVCGGGTLKAARISHFGRCKIGSKIIEIAVRIESGIFD